MSPNDNFGIRMWVAYFCKKEEKIQNFKLISTKIEVTKSYKRIESNESITVYCFDNLNCKYQIESH